MGAFLRSVLGVIAGVIVAMLIISLVEFGGSLLYIVDPDVVLSGDTDQVPFIAYITILVAWALGSFVGAWLAGRIAGRGPLLHGMIVTVLLLIAGVINMLLIPHPVWVWGLGIAGFILCGYAGARLAAKPKAMPVS